MPDPHALREHRWLRIFAPLFNDPNLLHFNRKSVSVGVFCGVFGSFIPLPVQMFVGVTLAIILRGNLAAAVGFTWVSNPLTYIPIYYFCYVVGEFIMGSPTGPDGQEINVDMEALLDDIFSGNLSNLADFFVTAGAQLMLGCVLMGLVAAALSYFLVDFLWRNHVLRSWRVRALARAQRHHEAQQKDNNN